MEDNTTNHKEISFPAVAIKNVSDEFEVEYDVLPIEDTKEHLDRRQQCIERGIASVDAELADLNSKLAVLDKDIDRLTNHADGLDYALAVTCGVITGIFDATVVGEWNFKEAKKETYTETNKRVIGFAQKHPDYSSFCKNALEGKGSPRLKPKNPNRLETAIAFLEWKYPLPGDGAYKQGKYGIGAKTHRLDDLCHHPTLVGLVCSIIVQFSGSTLYVNSHGEDVPIPITVNEYGNFVGTNFVTKLFSGVINWFISCAKTVANRHGHMMSDIATPAGVPGSFLSMITELASIPCFRDEKFLSQLRHAYTKGIGTRKGQVDLGVFNSLFDGAKSNFDMTTEKAIARELKRQAKPVIINEILVRGVYFVRRFISELKEKQGFNDFEWNKVVPFRNRTIVRMMTIATGTFTAIDMADAAIHAVGKSVDTTTFLSNMLLRVNFVGVGRFAIAIGTDTGMGISKDIKMKERIKIQEQQISLLEAKVFYRHADMWIAAEKTEKTLEEAYALMEKAALSYVETRKDINDSMRHIGEKVGKIEEKNPGMISSINDTLKWG